MRCFVHETVCCPFQKVKYFFSQKVKIMSLVCCFGRDINCTVNTNGWPSEKFPKVVYSWIAIPSVPTFQMPWSSCRFRAALGLLGVQQVWPFACCALTYLHVFQRKPKPAFLKINQIVHLQFQLFPFFAHNEQQSCVWNRVRAQLREPKWYETTQTLYSFSHKIPFHELCMCRRFFQLFLSDDTSQNRSETDSSNHQDVPEPCRISYDAQDTCTMPPKLNKKNNSHFYLHSRLLPTFWSI